MTQSVYGREEDKEIIVKMLLDQKNSNHAILSILHIMGMGGLGKMTLNTAGGRTREDDS